MGRIGITYHDVVQAANEVLGEQEQPTVERIRQKLGCGSNSTIARYLKDWKMQQNPHQMQGLPSELMAVITGLWQRLQDQAEIKIHEIKEELDLQIQHYHQQCQHYEQENHQLNEKIVEGEIKLNSANSRIEILEQEVTQQTQNHIKASEKIQSLIQQLDAQRSENKRIHQLLLQMQAHLEHYQNVVEKNHEEYLLNVETQRMHYENLLSQARDSLNEKMQIQQQLNYELIALQKDVENQKNTNTILLKKQDQLQQNFLQKELENTVLKTRCEQEEKINHQKEFVLQQKDQQLLELEKKVVVMLEQITQLKNTINQNQHHLHELEHENKIIQKEKIKMEEILKFANLSENNN